ncbi:MAG: hypothetical protein ACPH5J_07675 [Candidatus Puniceispirillum sp.]
MLPTFASFSAGVNAFAALEELEEALEELVLESELEADADEVPEADDDALSLALSLDVVEAVSQAARRKAAEKIAIRRCTIFMPSICLPVPGFVVHSLTLLVTYGLLLSEAGDRLRKDCISK